MKICRDIIDGLKYWKDGENGKSILLKEFAGQEKTWIMGEFGKDCFEYVAIPNLGKV